MYCILERGYFPDDQFEWARVWSPDGTSSSTRLVHSLDHTTDAQRVRKRADGEYVELPDGEPRTVPPPEPVLPSLDADVVVASSDGGASGDASDAGHATDAYERGPEGARGEGR